ncbi:MAG TPA: preprotein translocase subunit SecG [Tepidisphaeraceae bacterium]|jgi:preprotein translocase subunit SecG|nr:preprotein translocase subunit SecG [Tepidisphaeraceae bacterium]
MFSSALFYITMIAFVLISLFMILLVLVQKGRGGGLAAAFGGMGGNTAFGSKTGDVLTWTTAVVFGIFVVLAVVLNLLAEQRNRGGVAPAAAAATAATVAPETAPAATPAPTPAMPPTPAATTAPTTAATPTPTPIPMGEANVLNAPPTTAPAATAPTVPAVPATQP